VAAAISAGTVDVAKSGEALEGAYISIEGGDVRLTASDDGINAAGLATSNGGGGGMGDTGETLEISGGTVTVDADGDGLDSNGSMTISGGTVTVSGPTNDGNGALDVNGTFAVTGGTVLAVGSAGMAVSPGDGSTQAWISALASGGAGDGVQIVDSSGTVVASFTADKTFGSVVFTSADLVDGATYTVTVNGSTAATVTEGTATAGGMGGGMGGPGGGQRP
jgi:hypothetical protein